MKRKRRKRPSEYEERMRKMPVIDRKTREWFWKNHPLGEGKTRRQAYARFYFLLLEKKDNLDFVEEVYRRQNQLRAERKFRYQEVMALAEEKPVVKSSPKKRRYDDLCIK